MKAPYLQGAGTQLRICVLDGPRVGDHEVETRYFLTASFRPVLGAQQRPIKWVSAVLSPGGKVAGA